MNSRTRQARAIIVRHGLTANVHRGGLIDAAGMQAWRDATDVLGIAPRSHPPRALAERAANADIVMASDLRRAVESARRLAPGRHITISALFRESDAEIPTWLPMRWPLWLWRACTGAQWVYRIARGTDAPSEALERAAQASRLLGELSVEHPLIVVVCHRVFRRLLGKRLVADGWTREPGWHSHANWSAWEYSVEVRRTSRP